MTSTVYDVITNRILALLEQGVPVWRQTWTDIGAPRNLLSDAAYRGINAFLLSSIGVYNGYNSPYWLTYKQAKDRGGFVYKGESGIPVIFWKPIISLDETDDGEQVESVHYMTPRYYTVFNVEQCDGISYPTIELPQGKCDPIASAEWLITAWADKPDIRFGGGKAFYLPSSDVVQLPAQETFITPEHYYSTLFHELIHSTGHTKRIGRPSVMHPLFGSHDYSKEELIAEMGAAMLCGKVGIEVATIRDSASYIASWLNVLKSDHKVVIQAAGQAQKAVEYITAQEAVQS